MKESYELIRELAKKYVEIAKSDENIHKINLWKSINHLKPERPAVLVEEIPWHEFSNEEELKCVSQDNFLRGLEWHLRVNLYRAKNIKDDYVHLPYFRMGKTIHDSGTGIGIKEHTLTKNDSNNIYSHQYINQFETYEDLEKIKIPQIEYDEKNTMERYEQLSEIFGDILPVHVCGTNLDFQIWDWIVRITSPEFVLMSMVDDPDYLHALMKRVTSVYRARLDAYNKDELFDANHTRVHCSYVFNDELPNDKDISKNTWTYGTAQLFSSVSPSMHKEFDIDYVKDIFPEFGIVMYGCCEPLHDRMDMLFDNIPNLRKLSISPWCDSEIAAEKMGKKYVASVKPNPAYVGGASTEWEAIQKDLTDKRDIFAKNGTPCEFILKDISTVNGQPERLKKWADTASEIMKG